MGVVSTVSSTIGFECCFAFTMMMAATSAMVQPYAQPQARPHAVGIMFHGPWTQANNLSVKVNAQVRQNNFFGGTVWWPIWPKFIQGKAFSWWFGSTLWYFFGLTQLLFAVEWTYATVVSVDVSISSSHFRRCMSFCIDDLNFK